MKNYVYMTSLASDEYMPGVYALYVALKHVKSRHPLVVLCSEGISKKTKCYLDALNIEHVDLDEKISVSSLINKENGYQHWTRTFDKLIVWKQVQYDKIVLLDSDMLICQNIDELFEAPNTSAVIADIYDEPNCTELNSGLMVIEPSLSDYDGLLSLLHSGSIRKDNYGDQDVIRAYFSSWSQEDEKHLPIGYNQFYNWVGRTRMSRGGVKILHFVGNKKPWQFSVRAAFRRIKLYGGTRFLLKYLWYVKIKYKVKCLEFQYS